MTARPMTEKLEVALELSAAQALLDSIERDESGLVIFDQPGVNRGAVSTLLDFHVPAMIRALLSTSAAERRLREALEDALAFLTGDIAGESQRAGIIRQISAALSVEGEDEQARGQGRSAPTDRLQSKESSS